MSHPEQRYSNVCNDRTGEDLAAEESDPRAGFCICVRSRHKLSQMVMSFQRRGKDLGREEHA